MPHICTCLLYTSCRRDSACGIRGEERSRQQRWAGEKMIRDITIGQYYPADSILHRLDPRVKISCTLLYLISLFLFKSVLGYVIAGCFLAGVIWLSKVPVKFIVKGLKPVVMLLMITVIFNLFLTNEGDVLVKVWIFKITEGGLRTAVFLSLIHI